MAVVRISWKAICQENLDHNQFITLPKPNCLFYNMLVQMQFQNCTEIRFLFSTLNYIKYLKDKLFWVSILDDASSWNSIRFSQWQNQIVESFFWPQESQPNTLQVKRTNVCGKRWTIRDFLLSVINFGFCQSGRIRHKGRFWFPTLVT